MQDGWNNKVDRWSPASSAIEARARDARIWLRNLAAEASKTTSEDLNIVVVTHGGLLHYFTEDWDGYGSFTGTGWANTEFRSYQFVDAEGNDMNASFLETKESRERRKGSAQPLTADEQRTLKASAERAEDGYVSMETAKL